MTAITVNSLPYLNDVTNFRARMKQLSDAIKAVGMVQTSDSGQINWATVALPGTNTAAGYEIFRFSDALQYQAPVFIKIEYGISNIVNIPGFWATVGTGSDGAGNLTGNVTQRFNISIGSSTQVSNYNSYICGDTNRLLFCPWVGYLGYGTILSVERIHDVSGADTSNGVLVLISENNRKLSAVIPPTGTPPAAINMWNTVAPNSGTGAVGNDVAVYPVRGWSKGETSPSLNLFVYFNTDLTLGNQILTTYWDGVSRLLMPLGYGMGSVAPSYGGSTVVAIRFN